MQRVAEYYASIAARSPRGIDDVILCTMPFSHGAGPGLVRGGVNAGATMILQRRSRGRNWSCQAPHPGPARKRPKSHVALHIIWQVPSLFLPGISLWYTTYQQFCHAVGAERARGSPDIPGSAAPHSRSEAHTSALQSLMST